MHNFGDSFGFRRSSEYLWSGPESRFRVPVAATAATYWLQGNVVTIDPAAPGYLKIAADNDPIIPGVTGLLIQYDRFITPDGFTTFPDTRTRDLSRVVPGLLANIVTGAGIKVWVKNLDAVVASTTRKGYDAEARVDLTSVDVGDYIGWSGTDFEVKATAATAIGTVTSVTTTGCEFTLLA